MIQKEKKYFAELGENKGHLDAESAPFAVPNNAWVNMSDCRSGSTDKGVTATIESIGGTLRISTPSPSVSFIEIGNTTDVVGNRIIYAYYNTTTTQHKIEVYDKTDNTIYLALLSSQVTGGLGFSKDYPIHGFVVNGVWYFNDNYNPPRKLNIDAAIKMNNSSYSTTETAYTNPLEADVISWIRKPPSFALAVSKTTAGGITVNNVADFAGQFAWMFDFRDNERSVLSPVSKLINYNTVTDTYDTVRVVATDTTGTIEHISQDVQVVNFCVKPAGNSNFEIIKSWDKRIAADATAIANHNAGITALNFNFLNDRVGIVLDAAYSVKPFDSVPLLTETIETGLSRAFMGNNLEGFNTPVLTSLTATLVSETNQTPFQNPSFHSASPYQIGIIFRDKYKRVIGNVLTKDALRVQVPSRTYNDLPYYYYIAWTLSNAVASSEIPVDAYYYEIVVTKNLRTRFFSQAKAGGMKYAIKNPIGVITYQDTYISSAYGLAFDASLLNSEGMGYLFQEGDIITVIQQSSATQYSLAVIGQDGNYIISKLQDLGSFATQPNILFEIYSPYKEQVTEPYWTMGETYAITNPTETIRTYSAISGQIYGDIYRFNRFAPSGTYIAENMSPIPKYWKQWNTNSGEANFVINSVQVRKKTAVRYSNTIIEGSQTNGLSTFDALAEKILPFNLGVLRKLKQTSKTTEQGNIILAIGEDDTASLYLGEVQVVGAAQNAFLATSSDVIGTVNILKGNFGTVHPESVTEYRGMVFWFDAKNGRWVQYASNGLFPISNYKMQRFWKLWSEQFLSMTAAQIEALGGRPFVFTTVDPFHDELLISIPKLGEPPKGYITDYSDSTIDGGLQIIYPFDILDFQGKTMVYDLKNDRWLGSYSFNPEGFATLENQLYSFKDGQMYLHNQYDEPAKFYGVQYKPKIMFVSNSAPSELKSYNATAIESNIVPDLMLLYNQYPYIQQSDLVDFDFANLEGIWNATLYRNIIQPTATGFTATSRLTGERMRNTAMFIMLRFNITSTATFHNPAVSRALELKAFNITYSLSLGNTNV